MPVSRAYAGIITDVCPEFQAAEAKEQHTQKEYQASVEDHKRLHSSTEQAKAAYDKAQQDVSRD